MNTKSPKSRPSADEDPIHYIVGLRKPDADSAMTAEEVYNKHHEWLRSRLDGVENCLISKWTGAYCAKLSDAMVKELRERDDVESVEHEGYFYPALPKELLAEMNFL